MTTTQRERQRVVLAMSGGVDSSVAAHLLLEQGFEVIGVFMRHGQPDSECETDACSPAMSLPVVDPRQSARQGCCTARDARDARRVADRLGIPFYALNLEADFARIIDYFVDEYASGRTPNPCVMCNNWIKFGRLFRYADSVQAEYVATGHYARRIPSDDADGWALCRGHDVEKDQSYVLFGVARSCLPRMLLPVGEYRKPEIRRLAGQLGLRVADKPDSQEICFVASGQHAEFVRQRQRQAAARAGVPSGPGGGEIVTTDGRQVGHHDGIEGFTIGQRKGLGVALGEPYFVVQIQPKTKTIVIGRRAELSVQRLRAGRVNWLIDVPSTAFHGRAQIRYNSTAQPARITPLGAKELVVEFDEPCLGVAPGQAVVCYQDDRVLGGGWIEATDAATMDL